jgi:hypothetical protein
MVSGGRNYMKITGGIGDISKDVRARVSATHKHFSQIKVLMIAGCTIKLFAATR